MDDDVTIETRLDDMTRERDMARDQLKALHGSMGISEAQKKDAVLRLEECVRQHTAASNRADKAEDSCGTALAHAVVASEGRDEWKARAERAEVQLAGCGVVALDPRQMPDAGAYGWSASLVDVHRVRTERDAALKRTEKAEANVRIEQDLNAQWQSRACTAEEERDEARAEAAALVNAIEHYYATPPKTANLVLVDVARDPSPAVARMLAAVEVAEADLAISERDTTERHIDGHKDDCPPCRKSKPYFARLTAARLRFAELKYQDDKSVGAIGGGSGEAP